MNIRASTKRLVMGLLMVVTAPFTMADDPAKEALLAEIYVLFDGNTDLATLNRLRTIIAENDGEVRIRAKMVLADHLSKIGEIDEIEAIFKDLISRLSSFDRELQIYILIRQSIFESERNNYARAEEIIRTQALPMALPDSPQLAKVYRDLGSTVRHQSKIVEAKTFLTKSLTLYQQQGDRLNASRLHYSLGTLMESIGRVSEALNYMQQARAVAEEIGGTGDRAAIYYTLGNLYKKTGELDTSLTYYLKALELDTERNDMSDLGFDHHAIARVNMHRGDYVQALQHNLQAVDLRIKIKAARNLSESYLQQSLIYQALDDNAARRKSLTLAERAATSSGVNVQLQKVNFRFGEYHFENGEYAQAEQRLQQAVEASATADLKTNLLDIHTLLSQIHEQQNRFEQAHYHQKMAIGVQQEIHQDAQVEAAEKYKRDINLLQEQMKVSELEQEQVEQARLLEEERLQRRWMLMGFLVAVTFLTAVAYLLYQRRRLALLEAGLYQEALDQKDRLFADVSHELRTPLTSLKVQVDALQHNLVKDVDASYEKIGRKVMDINHLITDIYELAQADTGTLELHRQPSDLEALFDDWDEEFRTYVEGQGLRYQSEMQLNDDEISVDATRIKQVMFNLISNSCFYTDKPGSVRVRAAMKEAVLHVEIDDTAPTVEKVNLTKIFSRLFRVEQSRSRQTGGSGLGLAICKSLIEAHGGTIDARQSELGGLQVRFSVPGKIQDRKTIR